MKLVKISAAVVAIAGLSWSGVRSAKACFRSAGWVALLTPTKAAHANGECGRAQILFDPLKPFGRVVVSTTNVKDVTRIEMRYELHPGDLNGPLMAVVYDKSQGQFTGKLTKRINEDDVSKVPLRGVKTAGDVVNCITEGSAVVIVCTRKHPRGEVAGTVGLRSIIVYSDTPGGFHDPNLHKEAAQAKSST